MVDRRAQSLDLAHLEDMIREALTGHLGPGEIMTHFDLVVHTRDERDAIRRHHFAPAGSDPHLTYAGLSLQADTVRQSLTRPDRSA